MELHYTSTSDFKQRASRCSVKSFLLFARCCLRASLLVVVLIMIIINVINISNSSSVGGVPSCAVR